MTDDRELTQLISAAKYYLDAADSLGVPASELAIIVSTNSAGWSTDRLPHPLSPLDTYSAHLASCAARLATIHEILGGGTKQAWAVAYPKDANPTPDNVGLATTQALEILLRDNVGHGEAPTIEGVKKAKFRKAALTQLTFKEMHTHLRTRYQALANKLRGA